MVAIRINCMHIILAVQNIPLVCVIHIAHPCISLTDVTLSVQVPIASGKTNEHSYYIVPRQKNEDGVLLLPS